MKIKNSTDWTKTFLQRMASWCCKELDLPVRLVRQITFRNSRSIWGGAAYWWKGQATVCVSPRNGDFPQVTHEHRNGVRETIADRTEALIDVTAHELAHLLQAKSKTRLSGNGGGSEMSTDWHGWQVLRKFREQRGSLLAEWSKEPEPKNVIRIEPWLKRADKAARDLERWQRKLKLAQTKIRKLRQRVRYYDQRKAAMSK